MPSSRAHAIPDVRYRLNGRDEIEYVNEAWDAFALANGGERCASAVVLGRPLWQFVSDPTTQLLYRDILAQARGGRPMRFTLRCDSPSRRRRLAMEAIGGAGGQVEFRVRTLAEEERPPQTLLEPDRAHSDALVRICGWCKRVDVDGEWHEVEGAVAKLGLFEQPRLPRLTHGICKDCRVHMTATLGRGGAAPGDPATGGA